MLPEDEAQKADAEHRGVDNVPVRESGIKRTDIVYERPVPQDIAPLELSRVVLDESESSLSEPA